jgi:hypothetical protein
VVEAIVVTVVVSCPADEAHAPNKRAVSNHVAFIGPHDSRFAVRKY